MWHFLFIFSEHPFEVVLESLEGSVVKEVAVATEHQGDVAFAVGIAREFVMTLGVVNRSTIDLTLAFADEGIANLGEHGDDDTVKKVMALDVEIGLLGCDS